MEANLIDDWRQRLAQDGEELLAFATFYRSFPFPEKSNVPTRLRLCSGALSPRALYVLGLPPERDEVIALWFFSDPAPPNGVTERPPGWEALVAKSIVVTASNDLVIHTKADGISQLFVGFFSGSQFPGDVLGAWQRATVGGPHP